MKYTDVQILNTTGFPYGKKKAVCFTFDDCGWTSHRIAVILKINRIHATFFLNTKLITDKFYYRYQYRVLRWMGFELGSHTRNHKPLTSLPVDSLEYELQSSKQDIINIYGFVPSVFSYPESKSTDETDAHVLKWFLGVRYNTIIEGQQCYHIRSNATTDDYKKLSDEFVKGDSKALVIGGHGVDGSGYEPISSKNLCLWVNYLKQYDDAIWFASFGELAMYETIKKRIECKIEGNTIFINTLKIDNIINQYPDTPCLYPVNALIGGEEKIYTIDLRKQNKIIL